MQPTTELKAYFEPTVQWWGIWQVDLSKYLVSQKVLISWRSFGRSKTIYIYRLPWERAIPVPIPHNFLNITSKPELDTKFANRQQTTVAASLKNKKTRKKIVYPPDNKIIECSYSTRNCKGWWREKDCNLNDYSHFFPALRQTNS